MSVTNSKQPTTYPNFLVVLELLKPITWFPPMWAYACGVISSGASIAENLDLLILGIIVAGPVVCGMSQAANDWCDRHVDTINEPNRPIPSGRMPGNWGLKIALGGLFEASKGGFYGSSAEYMSSSYSSYSS